MSYNRKTIDRWDIETNYGYGWEVEISEYTLKEANQELKQLNINAQRYGSPFVFRKKFIYSAPVQTLSIKNHRYA